MNREEREELLRRLKAKQRIEEDSNLKNFIPTTIQKAFLESSAKIRIVEGGNRPGKTEICAVDSCIQITGVIPDAVKDSYPRKFIRAGNYWASSRTNRFSRSVAKPKLERYLPKRMVRKFHEVRNSFYMKSGYELGLKSMEEGVIGFEGDSRLQIWMDEEHSKDVYKAAYMRTIDCAGRLVMSFSPVEGLTWAYKDLHMKASKIYYTVSKHEEVIEDIGRVHTEEEIEKLKDRVLKCKINPSKDANPNVEVFVFTIYDNPYLPNAEIHNAEHEHKSDMAQYQARILGRFAKLIGKQVYPVEIISSGSAKCPSIFEKGAIEGGKWVSNQNGNLILFKKKEVGASYTIGADIAEGLEDGDYSCAQILNHRTCEQVAIWHGKPTPENFALILIQLGRYFNNAWLIPERNFHGFGVVNRIRDQRYPRLYCSDNPDLRVDSRSEHQKYGWDTNARTKPLMVQALGTHLVENHIKINDLNTWDELMTFVYLKNGKTGALKGCYDDRAIALMLALQGILTKRPVNYTPVRPILQPKIRPDSYTGY